MRQIRADLFCRVIDNLGDIGVMWRLARQLNVEKNWSIRLWVDNTSALARMLPNLDIQNRVQDIEGISICHWSDNPSDLLMASVQPNDVVIAGFSCELPAAFITKMCRPTPPIWFQLEYLSANHGYASFMVDRHQGKMAWHPFSFSQVLKLELAVYCVRQG